MQRVTSRLVAATALLLLVWAAPAAAHETREVPGKYKFVAGWGDEPTLTGFKNSVTLEITDPAGKPVAGIQGIKVQVKSGAKTAEYEMDPAFGEPGLYEAPLIPTRTGTYTFTFTGTVNGQAFTEAFTSSETTFDSPRDATELEFPDTDPSAGQLSERIARESARAQAARAAAKDANDKAASATPVGIAGIVIGALGLVVAGIALSRKR